MAKDPKAEGERVTDEQAKKAFDFASDASKQLITLSTGVIALTVTFNKDFIGQNASGAKGWLVAAWFAYLVSIFFGCWFLLSVAGTFAKTLKPYLYDTNTVLPAYGQVVAFVIALVLTVVFGWQAFGASSAKPGSTPIATVSPAPSPTLKPCVCPTFEITPTPAKSSS